MINAENRSNIFHVAEPDVGIYRFLHDVLDINSAAIRCENTCTFKSIIGIHLTLYNLPRKCGIHSNSISRRNKKTILDYANDNRYY